MTSFTPKGLKTRARECLRNFGSNAHQLILIHTGVVVLLSLISSGLHFYLDNQISSTGGLSGLSTRSFLQTLQTLMQYATTLFTPFWSAGFLTVAMLWSSERRAENKDLLHGFRRFGSIISYEFLLSILTVFLMLGTGYGAGILFSMTPYADTLMDLISPILSSGTMDLSLIPADALLPAYLPFLFIWSLIAIPVLTFFFYSIRFALYLILDHPQIGAMRAMAVSAAVLRGKKMQLFRLDLSFWWFYAMEALLLIVCYLDMILPALGISLPFSSTAGYFIFLALYGILQLLLHLWKKPEIETAYALAYRVLTAPQNTEPPLN